MLSARLNVAEIPADVRSKAYEIASRCDRDWRSCARWLMGLPVRPLTQRAVERALAQLALDESKRGGR
jgi:hypothetical protein